ncbi:hypothetical protein [Glutamicibacter sp. TV12E]|uniref:hypothetical protein n=1 Tax=Glutamicibacter sp. TV12E TaxID=3446362 RepID=UPI004034E6B6
MSTDSSPFIGDLPPTRANTRTIGKQYEVEKFAQLAQQHPGKAVRVATDVPVRLSKLFASYKGEPFSNDQGKIAVNIRNSYVLEDGDRNCDIYFTWKTKEN